jgi:hypothetical protein
MSLVAGVRLEPYEILSVIGAGGVYRAQDTKVHRDVVIKVQRESFANEYERDRGYLIGTGSRLRVRRGFPRNRHSNARENRRRRYKICPRERAR